MYLSGASTHHFDRYSSNVCQRNALSQIKPFRPLKKYIEPSHDVICRTDALGDVICGANLSRFG